MDRVYFRQIESIINKNLNGRGMDKIYLENELEKSSRSLYTGGTIFIVTGFVIRDTLIGETDGPVGAVSLAAALEQLGKRVILVTDRYSEGILKACAKVRGVNALMKIIPDNNEREFAEILLKEYRPSHVVAIERPGMSIDGKYYSMRGEDISDLVPNADILFEESARIGATTIAVGDGGNEIGMGKIRLYVTNSVYKGKQICAVFSTDYLIVSTVSNWGGHALVSALSLIGRQMLLHDPDVEERMIRAMIEAGAVDGCTKQPTLTVDGISLKENLDVLEALRRVPGTTRVLSNHPRYAENASLKEKMLP
jgi:hypothetical protein